MSAKLKNINTDWVDPDDAPELTDEYHGETLIRRGRPPAETPKKLLSVRFDPEVIEGFKRMGKGYQTKMNTILRAYVNSHSN